MADFDPKDLIFHYLIEFGGQAKPLEIIGPFKSHSRVKRLFERLSLTSGIKNKAKFFIIGENTPPQFQRAKKQIDHWRSYPERNDVFRFPYRMWHLDWPELTEVPEYPRYGGLLSIDRLLRPISDTYAEGQLSSRLNRAALFSKHLKEPKKRFFELTSNVIWCDGFGGAFGNDNRQKPKMPVM